MNDSITVPEFCDIVSSYICKSNINIVFDIGSRDGKDAIIMKNRFNPCNTYAIEAYDKEYNLHINEMKSEDITWINQVIYDFDGTVNFYPKQIGSGIHSIRNRGELYGSGLVSLPCKRIDTLCNEMNIPSIDIAKIDIEGCTFECIKSFGNIIKNIKALHIETETTQFFEGQHLHKEVCGLLKLQFELVKITRATIAHGEQSDSVWINKKLMKREDK